VLPPSTRGKPLDIHSRNSVLVFAMAAKLLSSIFDQCRALPDLGRFRPDNYAQKICLPRLSTANLSAELHPG
jgi:hypothetical protein